MKEEPIDIFLRPVHGFIKNETTAGIVLFINTVIALVWANSAFASTYEHIWHEEFSVTFSTYTISNSLHHWINDGLMSMFFFVVGLELKREIIGGELSSPRQALLPMVAALGGMVAPAIIFFIINRGGQEKSGWGIPMATDIAFALAVLALLGKRVPTALKVFLTALAIADDLGAVLIIAFFYTSKISVVSLVTGGIFFAVLMTANLLGVRNVVFYGIIGIIGLWLAFLMSGVHATIAGVIAAFTIPARPKIDEVNFTKRLKSHIDEFTQIPPNDVTLLEPEQARVIQKIQNLTKAADTPLQRLEHAMHPLVAYFVLPFFALANAGVNFSSDFMSSVLHPVSLGVMIGLLGGKLIGIVGACWIAVRMKWTNLPSQVTWRHIIGVGFLGGIGFTMSMFITNLAFDDFALRNFSKTGILIGSLLAGLMGFLILKSSSPTESEKQEVNSI